MSFPGTAKTDDIADAPRPANMRMIGFTCLIHLNADGGDADSLGTAARRREPTAMRRLPRTRIIFVRQIMRS